MMAGSSDSETISPICLACSYFCSRAPWGFLSQRPPSSPPHPCEPPGNLAWGFSRALATQMDGEAGPGELLFATRCMLHLPGAFAGREMQPAPPPSP